MAFSIRPGSGIVFIGCGKVKGMRTCCEILKEAISYSAHFENALDVLSAGILESQNSHPCATAGLLAVDQPQYCDISEVLRHLSMNEAIMYGHVA